MKTNYQMLKFTKVTLQHNSLRTTASFIDKRVLARINGRLYWSKWNGITFVPNELYSTINTLEKELVSLPQRPHTLYCIYKK
jgi:hypothetical protein